MAANISTLEPVLKDFYPTKKSKSQLVSPVVKGGALKGLREGYTKSDKQMKKDTKKSMKTADAKRAAAKRMVMAKTLQEKGGDTFDSKVAWVKENMPEITDPESFVAASLREAGEIA
jgi:hypothetical protein